MIFNKENYSVIRDACLNKKDIVFEAPKEITVFADDTPPQEWKEYPPTAQPPEGYKQIFLHAGNDASGELLKLYLLIYLDGGRILCKSTEKNLIAMKVTWGRQ